jgi:hypothetical protein
VEHVPAPHVPAAALFGVLPAFEIARVVELEDDLVLIVVRAARPEDVRAKVAGEFGGSGRDPGDPLFELLLAPRLHPPRCYRRYRRIVGTGGIPVFQRLAQKLNLDKVAGNSLLLNRTFTEPATQQRTKNKETTG